MPCETIKRGDLTIIVCSRGQRRKRCYCGDLATKLCDWPEGKGTCDKDLCDKHSVKMGPNKDYCLNHGLEHYGH